MSPFVCAVLLSDGVKLKETENSVALFNASSFFLKFFFKVILHSSIAGDCHLFHPGTFVVTQGVWCRLCLVVSSFFITNIPALVCVHDIVDAKALDSVTIVKHTSMLL